MSVGDSSLPDPGGSRPAGLTSVEATPPRCWSRWIVIAAVVVQACLPAVYKGDSLLKDGRVDDAIQVLEEAAQRQPEVPVVALVLGSA